MFFDFLDFLEEGLDPEDFAFVGGLCGLVEEEMEDERRTDDDQYTSSDEREED